MWNAAIKQPVLNFWVWLDGKKRMISIVLGNAVAYAEWIGTEHQITSPVYWHTIHHIMYLGGMLGLAGIAHAAGKKSAATP